MPVVHRNVLKAARQALKRRTRNRAVLSGVKGVIKKLQTAIQQKQAGQATELLREASRALQRAASEGVIHRKAASRTLSRLTAQMPTGMTASPARRAGGASAPGVPSHAVPSCSL